MTINLLPIILVGGAAAVAVSRSRKKEPANCPPNTVITDGEMKHAAQKATSEHRHEQDPSMEANFFIGKILPPGCNRASALSNVKFHSQGKKFELSIPDVYMVTVAQLLTIRVGDSMVSEKGADELWDKNLKWYKKTTESNFDIDRVGIAELGKSVLESFKYHKNDKKTPVLGGCPDSLSVEMSDFSTIEKVVDSGISNGIKDPFKIADKVMSTIFPYGCSKADYQSEVTLFGDPADNMNLSVFYAALAWDISKRMFDLNMIGPTKLDVIRSKIISDYKNLTGEPFPEDLN